METTEKAELLNKQLILDLLTDTQEKTLSFFDLPFAQLQKTYGEGKWNIRQVLHHLTDTEFVFHARFKTIIAEPKQLLWRADQNDWNAAFKYIDAPLDGKKELFQLLREQNKMLIVNYYDEYGAKEFVHSSRGLCTLRDEFEKLATHNRKHNGHIQLALDL